MSLLDYMPWRRNPTRNWKHDPFVPLVLDLDNHKISGVGIDDPLERVSFLGQGVPNSINILFANHGIAIEAENGRIVGLITYFGHRDERGNGKFTGSIQFRGGAFRLPESATEQWLKGSFGEPYWRDEDEKEIILFYEFGSREWQIELGLDQILKAWVISRPLLSDAEQREAYKVTKAWPPRMI